MPVLPLHPQTESLVEVLKTLTAACPPELEIYTDGACSGNPGIGGWGAVLYYQGLEQDMSGGESFTTNNRMEMSAAILAMEALPCPAVINIYTDSQYLRDGITRWMINWKKNSWLTADKKPVKNKDLWLRLDEAARYHKIAWHWVRGHSGHPQNERADALARNAIIAMRMKMME